MASSSDMAAMYDGDDFADLVGPYEVDEALHDAALGYRSFLAEGALEGQKPSPRGLAYSLPVHCVSIDADGNTLRGSSRFGPAGEIPRYPISSERAKESFGRKLDSFSRLPQLSTPAAKPAAQPAEAACDFRMDDETGYAEIPWHQLPERELSHATLSRVYRRERAQTKVVIVSDNLKPNSPRQLSLAAAEAKVELAKTKSKARRRRQREGKQNAAQPSALSVAQIDGLKGTFQEFDENGDGTISTSELSTVLQAIGYTQRTQAELEAIVVQIDADNSGTIDFTEFLMLIQQSLLNGGGEGMSDGEEAAMW